MQMTAGEAPVWLNIIVVRIYDYGLKGLKKINNLQNCENKY